MASKGAPSGLGRTKPKLTWAMPHATIVFEPGHTEYKSAPLTWEACDWGFGPQEPKRQRRRPTRKSAAQILAEQYMDDTRRVNTLTGFITRPIAKRNRLNPKPRKRNQRPRP